MTKTFFVTATAVLLFSGVALAKEKPKTAPVTVTTQSYQQVPKRNKKGKVLKDKKGKPILIWARATKVVPGTVIRYIDTVTNRTDKAMSDVVIKNPINPHLTYVAKTAKCETGCQVYYSVDGGKHFGAPSKLFVKDKKSGKKRLATPKEYNAIEWVIASVPAQSKTTVEFKAKLK